MSYDYDLFVIGAGSGGVRAARRAAETGAKTAIAEGYRVGGTCVIRGCVPKKLFVHASQFRSVFKKAEGFGWSFDSSPHFDWPSLREGVGDEVTRLSSIYEKNLKKSGVTLFHDHAVLESERNIRLIRSGKTISARYILISTGATPYRPSFPGADLAITSDEVFSLPSWPKRVAILGGGYIAVEFAGIFSGLGVETCLINRSDSLLRGFDPDLQAQMASSLKARGVHLMMNRQVQGVKKISPSGFETYFDEGEDLQTDLVFMALGRRPATQGLGLEKSGVQLNGKGEIVVNEFYQTSRPHIYALGDVIGGLQLTPVAIRQGEAFVKTVFKKAPTHFDTRQIPTAVFSQPPLGSVGLSEPEARRVHGDIDVYATEFSPLDTALSKTEESMFMKLVVRSQDERVVGAHLMGPYSDELIQVLGVAVKAGLKRQDFETTCAVHPTLAEELVTLRKRP